MARGKKLDESLDAETARRAIGLYDDALEAAKSKDISGLSWALLRT